MPSKKKKAVETAKLHSAQSTFAENRKVHHDYTVLRKLEAGLELRGSEAKAIRVGKAHLRDSYAKFDRHQELYLINTHIGSYQGGFQSDLNPTRRRKLLLKKSELLRLRLDIEAKRLTLVPLRLYRKRNLIKVELGLVQVKKRQDKKQDLKNRDLDREAKRAIREFSKG